MAEVADQLGNPHSILENEELLCPECGDLFKLSGYKVEKVEIKAWKLAHSGQRRDETQNVESILEVDLIPEQELQENEALQPQHLGNIELLPSESGSEDINSLPDQEQQSGDTKIIQERPRHLKVMETKQDVETQNQFPLIMLLKLLC